MQIVPQKKVWPWARKFFNKGQFLKRAYSISRGWGNQCLSPGRMRRRIWAADYRIHCTLQYLTVLICSPGGKTNSVRCVLPSKLNFCILFLLQHSWAYLLFCGAGGWRRGTATFMFCMPQFLWISKVKKSFREQNFPRNYSRSKINTIILKHAKS